MKQVHFITWNPSKTVKGWGHSSWELFYWRAFKALAPVNSPQLVADRGCRQQCRCCPSPGVLQQPVPGGDAAEDGVEVVAAEREEHPRGGAAQLGRVLVPLAVRVDEVADLGQQLLHQHGLVQAHGVLRLLQTDSAPLNSARDPTSRPAQSLHRKAPSPLSNAPLQPTHPTSSAKKRRTRGWSISSSIKQNIKPVSEVAHTWFWWMHPDALWWGSGQHWLPQLPLRAKGQSPTSPLFG